MSEHGENSPAEASQGETVSRAVCRQCFELLGAGDNFCRYCGAMTQVGVAMVKIGKLPPPASSQTTEKPPSWAENPVVVLLALFTVLGPFALPMLWRSRRFTRGWKIGLTLAMLLLTVVACWYVAVTVNKLFDPLLQELRRAGLQ